MLLNAAIIWIGVVWAYVALMHAKAKAEAGNLTLFWKVHLYPLAAVGLVLDLAFNVLFGSLMFREWPRELLFSSRVQRHVTSNDDGKRRLALFWARNLNVFDSKHIRVP